MQGKTRRRINWWLRKFFCWTTKSTSDPNIKTKAINAQFGPFSRDNLTPQTLILIVLASFYINIGKLRSKRGFKHKKPNVWATLPMNLEIETLGSIGRGSIGMKAQHWSYHPCRVDISYLAWISFSKCDLLPCDATNVMQCQCVARN